MVGLIVWVALATVVNLLFRALWTAYAQVEAAMQFTLPMMVARLALGALASLCSGAAAAWTSRGKRGAAVVLGILLTALFIPAHYRVWDRFPVWYHIVFLVSLLPLVLLGAQLARPGSVDRQGAAP